MPLILLLLVKVGYEDNFRLRYTLCVANWTGVNQWRKCGCNSGRRRADPKSLVGEVECGDGVPLLPGRGLGGS